MQRDIPVEDLKNNFKRWMLFLSRNLLLITVIALVGGVLGFFYFLNKKPVYTAELTFATNNNSDSKLGSYISIASQFGIDLPTGSTSIFEGDDLLEFLQSKLLIEKTLLSRVNWANTKQPLLIVYLQERNLYEKLKTKVDLNNIDQQDNNVVNQRAKDSIIQKVILQIAKELVVEPKQKNLSIISMRLQDTNEMFAKEFVEQLTKNAIEYFTNFRTQKAKQNVTILQRQTDSIKAILYGGIYDVAITNDINVNALKQVTKVPTQKKMIDVQGATAMYTELVKNLEIAKLTLSKETPFIQIIDEPKYPLKKSSIGKYVGAALSSFLFMFFGIVLITFKKLFL